MSAFPTLPASEESAGEKLLTLEQTSRRAQRISFRARAPRWSFAPDGIHLVRGRGEEAKWVHPKSWEEIDPPATAEEQQSKARAEALLAAFVALEGVDEELAKDLRDTGGSSSDDGQTSVRTVDGRLWLYDRATGARALSVDDRAQPELARISPDGRQVAYVSNNDLWVVDCESGEHRALTTNGSEDRLNGKLDWIYQEEVYGRGRYRAFWWSPNSKQLALLSIDVSDVPVFPIVDQIHEGPHPVLERERYPKPGDPNPRATLGIAEIANGSIKWADLDRFAESEPIIARVEWNGESVVCVLQDRIQSWLELLRVDAQSGRATRLVREESQTWIRRGSAPRWLEDGSFLWLTDRTGYRQLEHRNPNGELIRSLTSDQWNVEKILAVDSQRGLIWFSGDGQGAVNEDVYRLGLDGEGFTRLTRGPGRHRVSFRADHAYLLDESSSLDSLPSIRLCDADGELVKELGQAEVATLDEYRTSTWELLEVTTRDGAPIDVAILKPLPFDPERSYPVFLPTYSGPNSPSVRNSWRGDSWHQFLAQQGVIVMQVNVRSASHKGHWATGICHRQLGVPELADLEDAVRWITAHPWADEQLVGIGGGSYGGFITAYALTHSELFALGLARSGVYDWRLYDSFYTECYMDRPSDNLEGYQRSSVIEAAGQLSGHLLLTHGTIDDNVHVQNTLRLVHALQKAGKSFELMLYPDSRHAIRDGDQAWHLRQLEWKLIREHLRPQGAAAQAREEHGGGQLSR